MIDATTKVTAYYIDEATKQKHAAAWRIAEYYATHAEAREGRESIGLDADEVRLSRDADGLWRLSYTVQRYA